MISVTEKLIEEVRAAKEDKPHPMILLVDDCELDAQLMGFALLELDCWVAWANTGEKALDRIAEGDVDAVLLDLRLPGMDGVELLRRIRGQLPHLPVLVVSDNSPNEAMNRAAQELGCLGPTRKPMRRDEMRRMLVNEHITRDKA